jgi:predicted secreted hydrolase
MPLSSRAAEVWNGTWKPALAGSERAMILTLTRTKDEVAGTVEVDGQTLPVTGKIEGAWRELLWKDAAGRVTQFRGVANGRTWFGLTLSGGDGRLVEYGRVKITRGL